MIQASATSVNMTHIQQQRHPYRAQRILESLGLSRPTRLYTCTHHLHVTPNSLALRLRCMRLSGHVKRGTTAHASQFVVLLLWISTAATVSAGTPSWRQCSPGGPALEIHGVDLEPLPPRRGQDFQYQLEATANAPVQVRLQRKGFRVTVRTHSGILVLLGRCDLLWKFSRATGHQREMLQQHGTQLSVNMPQKQASRREHSGTLLPTSPVHPAALCLLCTACLPQQAALTATVYYWGVPVYTQQGLLCNSSDSGIEVTCPIAPGPVSMAYHGHMPDSAPLGRYSLRIMAADAGSGATLMCVDAWFGVSHAPPSIVSMWWQLIRDTSRAAFGSSRGSRSSVQRGSQQDAQPAAPAAVAA